MNDVYITRSSHFLPNNPVENDDIEKHLGAIKGSSKVKSLVLRNNGIKKRYYAIDDEGVTTHTNAELTFQAIKALMDGPLTLNEIELLSSGTSTPDLLLPSHAAMVHGLMKTRPIELNSSAGICCSGMSALKYAYFSVLSGNTENAVSTGSERVSTWLRSVNFENEIQSLTKLQEKPILAFKKDFLRWMLSDGAGALLLENKPSRNQYSLKVEWIDFYSYAHELEACMYAGGEKRTDGSIKPWSEYEYIDWGNESIFSIKQDVKLLSENIIDKGVQSLTTSMKKHHVHGEEIDFFLPHISSFFFKEKLQKAISEKNLNISEDRWFLNLDKVGNVGSASIYLMVDELLNSGLIEKGNKVLLSVPESGRFSYSYALLTVI